MPRVIVLDNIAQEGLDLLGAASDIEYEVQTGLSGDELREALANFDGAVCRSKPSDISAAVLDGSRRLKAIVRAGVGTDNIDKTAATRNGIVVMNTPTGNTISTAEHAFTLMLALSRNIAPAYQSLIEGRWDRKLFMGSQLADKTLGVVGLGRIGQEVAKRAQAFEMKVIGYDKLMPAERIRELGIEPVDNVHEMLPKVDYLTVHTPLTAETKGMIGAAEIEMLKPGVRLINCARGGIYDEAALASGLESGKLAGVALDVYESEPCTDSPLFGMKGALCTPHLGASTEEAQTQVALEAVQLLVNFLTTGEIRHAVNVASVDPKTLASMRGDLVLAHRLGLLVSQWHGAGASAYELTYRGAAAGKQTRLLTSAFCAGLMERMLDEEVNIINAEMLLRDRGVHLVEQTDRESGTFSSSMTVKTTVGDTQHFVAGTLFGADMPRLVRIDDYRMEAYLDGVLFIFSHRDVPGIIGRVGSVLGEHEVNIAQMAVGRAAPGGDAIGVLNLDSAPPEAAMTKLLNDPAITSAKVVELPLMGAMPPWLQM